MCCEPTRSSNSGVETTIILSLNEETIGEKKWTISNNEVESIEIVHFSYNLTTFTMPDQTGIQTTEPWKRGSSTTE